MTPPSSNGTAAAPLARNEYREGQVLRARDLERESGYFLARDRQHAALAHSPGILFGLQVTALKLATDEAVSPGELREARERNETVPLDLFVTSGAAVDAFGRLIIVPRREQLRTELALDPSPLRGGSYRLELLYHRQVEGPGGAANGGCGGGTGAGGGAVVRESYRFRLMDAQKSAAEPPGNVLDGPPDASEAEAPVVLGTLTWNADASVSAFTGYSETGRRYAGVQAQHVRTPDGQAELVVHDSVAGLSVRFADVPAPDAPDPFTPGPVEDRFRVDPQGNVWAAGDVSVAPSGVVFRSDPNTGTTRPWGASLYNDPEGGGPFVSYAKEYTAGQRELRVALERGGEARGTQRVVVGFVDRVEGQEVFRPAVVVYDAYPVDHREQAVVEVWGDLHVRGIAHLHGVQRIPRDKEEGDELNRILTQMAGPLGGALRAVLVTDTAYLRDLGTSLARRGEFINEIIANKDFIPGVAGALTKSGPLFDALVDRLKTDNGLIDALATGVVNRIAADGALAQKVADAVAGRLQATPSTAQLVADAVAGRIQATPATAQTVATAVAAQIQATPATAQTVATAVAAQIQATPATALVVANAVAAQVQANPTTTAQTIATAVAGRIQATPATAGTVATAVAAQIQATPATALVVANAVAAQAQANPTTTAQTLATAVAGRIQATPATALTVADAVAEQIRVTPATALKVTNAMIVQVAGEPQRTNLRTALGIQAAGPASPQA